MDSQLKEIVDQYDSKLPLDQASTIPSSWYTNKDFFWHELKTVFSRSWQLAARRDQVTEPGNYVTSDIAGELLGPKFFSASWKRRVSAFNVLVPKASVHKNGRPILR